MNNLVDNSNPKENSVKRAKPSFLKKALCIGVGGLLGLATASASAADLNKVKKELRIMSQIFETSLSDAQVNSSQRVFPTRSGSTQSIYLAQQGMVFTFSFSSSDFGSADDWQAFGEGVGRLVGSIASEVTEALSEIDTEVRAPRAPRAPSPILDNRWEEQIEAYEAYQDALDDLRDQQRERREEIRDLQRNIRDIERESRHNQEDKKQLADSKALLKKNLAELEKKKADYEKSMEEYREKKNQKSRERNKKKSDVIVGTLCDYGSTLRSLDSDEHITLIFSDYQNGKDQVYVFDYDDVKDCSSKDKLLKSAVSYQL